MQLDIDHLKGWIGSEEVAGEILTSGLAERFEAMLDGQGDSTAGAVASVMIHYCLGQPAARSSTLGEDGHPPRGGFMPPVPLPRRMWAASTLEFTGDIRIGDMVGRRSRVTDVEVKQGRSGILCFVTLDHAYVSGGLPVLNERQTIVYRDNAAAPSPPAQAMAAEKGEHMRTVTPTPPLLFRYSALTFNGHRIHYDLPYATGIEGYPGLVVHGPLQATLLARFAQELAGKRPARIRVRALSSLYSTGGMVLNARWERDEMLLWTCSPSGPVAMETRVQW